MAKTPKSGKTVTKARPASATLKATSSMHKVQVGRHLAMARESLGRKQAEFARTYGVTPNRWNQWEAGLYYPNPYVLGRICADHGFTMDWFYRGSSAGVSYELAVDLRQAVEEKSAAE